MESLLARLKEAAPDTPIVDHQLLTNYDSYYYSRGDLTPLPVLRVKFADPMQTWIYVDPVMSQMLAYVHKYSRIERWLYNGLHSLDFSFWYNKRPLWDVGNGSRCFWRPRVEFPRDSAWSQKSAADLVSFNAKRRNLY